MANDFYVEAASARANQIECELAACKADLLAHKSNSDVQGAAQAVQQIANLEAEKQNLTQLYQSYVASKNPPAPPEESFEQKQAKPWDKMNWNDALDLVRGTKLGKDLTLDDPNVQAGMREVMRRRQRGE
jgi:hypothetical protein